MGPTNATLSRSERNHLPFTHARVCAVRESLYEREGERERETERERERCASATNPHPIQVVYPDAHVHMSAFFLLNPRVIGKSTTFWGDY